ncbi:hypothetical protein PVAR5_2825 [Paecilomyces variotii No. 5]|uniref:Uncharacterized protein n=1 Tax=Byssochlamys spectabilis (strain No. 5 / NBRC 109023) TaxID=1356009 RepID=V5FQD4_BYSSN|nr:hypothetical protein PVAR5_2825 [Paecilomyces variotii No. 5]
MAALSLFAAVGENLHDEIRSLLQDAADASVEEFVLQLIYMRCYAVHQSLPQASSYTFSLENTSNHLLVSRYRATTMPSNMNPPVFNSYGIEYSPTPVSYPSDPSVDIPEPYPKNPHADQGTRVWIQVPPADNPLLSGWAELKPQVTERVRAAGLKPVVYDIRVAADRIWNKTITKDAAELIIFVEGIPLKHEGELYIKSLEAMKDIHELSGVAFVVLQQCPRQPDSSEHPEWIREIGDKLGWA